MLLLAATGAGFGAPPHPTSITTIAIRPSMAVTLPHPARARLGAMALEHVAQGQTRFFTPGVAPDPRGILLGRYCMMTFPTLEGAVSWLRLYSAEASLDELMAGLTITKAKTALGSREIVIMIPAVSSYA